MQDTNDDENAPGGMPHFLAERMETHGVVDGIHWAICKAPRFGYNGYASLPADHPWRGMHYDSLPVDVNGGLTFGISHLGPREEEERETNGWIGFDCQHSWDYWGADEDAYYEKLGIPGPMGQLVSLGARTWTKEQVIEEAKYLAKQVAAAYEIKVIEGETA